MPTNIDKSETDYFFNKEGAHYYHKKPQQQINCLDQEEVTLTKTCQNAVSYLITQDTLSPMGHLSKSVCAEKGNQHPLKW